MMKLKTATKDTTDDRSKIQKKLATDEEQVLNLIMAAEIPTMDSALVTDPVGFDLLNNVNEGLYRLNQENIAVPAISDGEPTVSEDGLVYTFKLRDANWSDGTPVTANDFEYCMEACYEPRYCI